MEKKYEKLQKILEKDNNLLMKVKSTFLENKDNSIFYIKKENTNSKNFIKELKKNFNFEIIERSENYMIIKKEEKKLNNFLDFLKKIKEKKNPKNKKKKKTFENKIEKTEIEKIREKAFLDAKKKRGILIDKKINKFKIIEKSPNENFTRKIKKKIKVKKKKNNNYFENL